MDKQKEKLKKMLLAERERVKGYEQVAKVHSAYISILLKKLGAAKDNTVTITDSEIRKALNKYEARAVKTEDGWGLYCEVKE